MNAPNRRSGRSSEIRVFTDDGLHESVRNGLKASEVGTLNSASAKVVMAG
ncbi:hypothetical protein GXB81_25615 [Paraburkholderia sp. Ac-20336]|nr:hypothetical protein [Paraburkholderia sp. Ac-20336]MBN3806405.1 hypothetical protein [Paraburkholderia sp. Ac-20336]